MFNLVNTLAYPVFLDWLRNTRQRHWNSVRGPPGEEFQNIDMYVRIRDTYKQHNRLSHI